jgi:hypothetical protein
MGMLRLDQQGVRENRLWPEHWRSVSLSFSFCSESSRVGASCAETKEGWKVMSVPIGFILVLNSEFRNLYCYVRAPGRPTCIASQCDLIAVQRCQKCSALTYFIIVLGKQQHVLTPHTHSNAHLSPQGRRDCGSERESMGGRCPLDPGHLQSQQSTLVGTGPLPTLYTRGDVEVAQV